MAMSLRYGDLAPDQRVKAVARLAEKPLLATTLRLPWTEPLSKTIVGLRQAPWGGLRYTQLAYSIQP
ncbi:MAG: hypothetical protein IT480_05345 [Gammaproteobacteria bacterium]|nr:hypothetical protein [Gammaproteobacteria bacterium]